MPLYEYECETCGRRFELIQRFSDPPQETCPTCGGPVRKLISSPAIQFKGTGWYVTDYAAKDKARASAAAEKKDAERSKDTEKTKDTEKSKDRDSKADSPSSSDSTKSASSSESSTASSSGGSSESSPSSTKT